MIGTTQTREIVDWEKTDDGGETVYVIEYSDPVTEPTIRASSLFGATTGGSVRADDQGFLMPDGERLPATELAFAADGNTLRVRHRGPSKLARIRRVLFPWW